MFPSNNSYTKSRHINLFFLWCLVSSSYHTKSFTIILRKYEKCQYYIWFHNVRKYDFPIVYSQLVSGWCEHNLWKEHVACFVHTTLKESLWHASGMPRLDLLIHHCLLPLWWCFPVSVFSNHQVHYSCKRVHCFVKSRSRVNIGFPTAVLSANTISRETHPARIGERRKQIDLLRAPFFYEIKINYFSLVTVSLCWRPGCGEMV